MAFVRASSAVTGMAMEGGTTVLDIEAVEVCVMAVAHGVAAAEADSVPRSLALNTKCYGGCWDCEGERAAGRGPFPRLSKREGFSF